MAEKIYHIIDRLQEEKITKVNAGYRTFDIHTKRVLKDDGEKCYGLTDFDKSTISLDTSMSPDLAKETLLHELTHIVLEICGLGGEGESGIIRERNNEEITTLISRGFLLLMNLNPKLFEIINEHPNN